jgi:hypothetical protein
VAKAYKNAGPICFAFTIVAAIGIVFGLITWQPLVPLFLLIPTIVYEVYRTEGESTKWASRLLLLVFILEIVLIAANISFDLSSFLGQSERWVAGYRVPLGDIKVVGPAVMAILSVVLFIRTRGRYTKWLAVVIFITAFAIVYTMDRSIFSRLVRIGIDEGLNQIR